MKTQTSTSFHPLQDSLDWPKVLATALQEGGEWADVFWERTENCSLETRQKTLQKMLTGYDEGIGIRVLHNSKTVYGYTNELSERSIMELARKISSAIHVERKDPYSRPQSLLQIHGAAPPRAHSIHDASLERKLSWVRELESTCWKLDNGIFQVGINWNDKSRKTFVFRSNGSFGNDEQNHLTVHSNVTGRSPTSEPCKTNHRFGGQFDWKKLDEYQPETLAKTLLKQLQTQYSAKPAPSGTMPVIIGGIAGGTLFHEAVGHGLEADYACEGMSVYSNKLGQQVASELITLIDDGSLSTLRGSQNIDDEGNRTQRNILIKNGKLESYLVDQRMSIKTGLTPTGSGRRESYRHVPQCRMSNTFVAEGGESAEKIIRDTPWGLYVTELGGGSVDIVSGDFVFAASEAFLIRGGEIAEAVRGATLTGNGPKVMLGIDRVGNDVGFEMGTCGKLGQWVPVTTGQPTLRISQLTVGGVVPMSDYFSV